MLSTDRQSWMPAASSAGFPIAAYLAAMVVLATGAAAVLDRTVTTVVNAQNDVPRFSKPVVEARPTIETRAYSVVLNDEFTDQIRSRQYWSDRKSGRGGGGADTSYRGGGNRSGLGGGAGFLAALFGPSQPAYRPDPGGRKDGADWYRGDGETYATVCVRLCDGSYTPVSFSTSRDQFDKDEQTCKSSCQAPTRLFVYRNPGGTIEEMADVRGQPYIKLTTAFLFRTKYDAQCKCKPHPWEQQALDRHRMYALQDQVRKGNKRAAAELKEMTTRVATKSTTTDVRLTDKRATVVMAGVLEPLLADGARPPVAPAAVTGAPEAKMPDAVVPSVAVAPIVTQPPVKTTVAQQKPQRTVQTFSGDGSRMRLGAAGGRDPSPSQPQRSNTRGSDWKARAFENSR